MEFLLGVSGEGDTRAKSQSGVYADVGPKKTTRYDVDEADALDQDENMQLARERYQRMFWEAIPEGAVRTSHIAPLHF
jgi:hypothetical protein